ncbi:hypothetical protein [Prosthecobacter fusiformis]|uniref:hypothetical protein n=1 Tax=Prosthecobacter fusiformis TaxID=48464 RepID=UPI001AAEB0C8|nr:hypothetical protein [Prosthecobacter fusiformis]
MMTRFLALPGLLMALALVAHAEPPPPPKGERGDRPPGYGPPKGGDRGGERGDRDRGGDRGGDWRGGMSGYGGRPPMRHDGFDKLPEEEKKRVREALDKVWSRPEVIAAKDKAMRANEEMRDTIRESLAKIDPDAAAILARIEPKDHFDPRDLPKLPPSDSPEFPQMMVKRMGMELLSFSRPERREETRQLHDRVMAQPQVAEAVSRVVGTTGEERIQAVQKLREAYREAVGKEFQAARERRAAEGAPPPEKP